MNLLYCTLTGVDHETDINKMVSLTKQYPFVEWGFLFSKTNGLSRFCSSKMIIDTVNKLPLGTNIAVHFCGQSVFNLLAGNDEQVNELFDTIKRVDGRIQLNFNYQRCDANIVSLLDQFLLNNKLTDIIIQYNDNNEPAYQQLKHHNNLNVLFDYSGGRGIEVTEWPDKLPDIMCGYAGGLGPDNVVHCLSDISQCVQEHPFWIDMENKLRTYHEGIDWFNLYKCLDVLRMVKQRIK